MDKKKILFGLFLLLAGAFLIVNRLGYFPSINVYTLFFTVLLVGFLIKSVMDMNFGGILFSLAFIAILYDDQLGITMITPWTVLLAALLGTIGLSLIFKKKKTYDGSVHFIDVDAVEEGVLKYSTTFGSSVKYINTDQFESARLDCSFGGMKIFFDNAKMQQEQASLHIDVSFSGVELYIPREWTIVNHANVTFGSVEEKNKGVGVTGTHILTLTGNVTFSGVEIVYI